MKTIQIVRDSKGKILATTELARGDEVAVSVELERDQKLEEIEVPEDYVFDQIKTMQVVRDSKGKMLAAAELPQGDEVGVSIELEKDQVLEEIEAPGNYLLELSTFFEEQAKRKKA